MASLLVPPLLGLIAIFAREREARGATRSRASASWSESAECSGEMGPVVRHHHERFDGTGYPDGLRDEEIPLASRVISASDAFHAMISERPYREPLSLDAAINELHESAGGQFDPRGRGRGCRNRGGVGRPQAATRRAASPIPTRHRAQARARDRLSTRATLLLPGGVAERLNAPAYAPAL